MLRAIFRAIGWFLYSVIMMLLGATALILNVFLEDQVLLYAGYASCACVILGMYKILSVKIKY